MEPAIAPLFRTLRSLLVPSLAAFAPAGMVLAMIPAEIGGRGAANVKLFRRIFTTDKATSAIRLTICRVIVEAHGGRIRVAFERETAVHFALPCAESRAHNVALR